jgi:hypothetical protein
MGLFSFLFGKKKEESKPKETILEQTVYEEGDSTISFISKLAEDTSEEGIAYDEYRKLLKESTSLKKENKLDEAIIKIYEAIEIIKPFNNDTSEGYFKIAYYHQCKNEWDKSWSVLQKVLDTANPNDYEQYWNVIADVFQKQSEQLKRQKNLKEYLYSHSISFYTNLIRGMLYPAVWSPLKYFENEKELRKVFDVKVLKNDSLREEYIKFNVFFLNSKKNQIFMLYEYLAHKEFRFNTNLRDKKVICNLLAPLHFLELEDLYNKNMSPKLSNVKWNQK